MKVAAKINMLVAGGLLAGVASATFALYRGAAQEADFNSLLTHEVAQMEAARQMQVGFKKQVQAWKDILLRGSDPASLDKYTKEFSALEKAVDDAAATLGKVDGDKTGHDKILAFAEAHKQLNAKYEAGLEVFQASNGRDFAAADKMLKGQDRAPTDLIDGVVEDLQKAYVSGQQRIAASAISDRRMCVLGIIGLTAVALWTAMKLSRKMTTAILAVLARAEAIAGCDLTGAEIQIASDDELGGLATAVNTMQANLRKVIESVTDNAHRVATTSEEFSANSRMIAANSEETSAQANNVSAATEEVNRSLQTVATATEEMSASVEAIAKNAGQAAKVAEEALQAAVQTNASVSKLGESSSEIGKVIKVINSIAQQTNLLALNATIEAARAGDAGKGFAVVASEVKELAKQTARATEDISQKITAIQTDTHGAVEAISAISKVIGRVSEISATIATAVEEQSATTMEMSRNLTEAAKGSNEVARNITGVAQAAHSTSSGAVDSNKGAQELAQMSTQLNGLVSKFKLATNGKMTGHARITG